MFEEQHQEALAEFKGARKLAKDLPHAVQEEQEDGGLLARFAVGVGWLSAALAEWVTRLRQKIVGVRRVVRKGFKADINPDIEMLMIPVWTGL